ncbi:MAG: proton-conducting transporter membrane subunit [Candidatus Gracilibacteria bacterium]|nr:proton-conducting transporter membrane subunit [Candidatus Gracilibacteria bacterium]
MEILFYTSLLAPLLLALGAIFTSKDFARKYLQINRFAYLILAILAVFFYIKGITIDTTFFTLDKINIVFYSIIFLLSFLISAYAVSYFGTEIDHKEIGRGRLKQYNMMINFFILSMLFVAISKNLMVMWIALEATTIFTTFLISFYGTKSSWEAAWKYVILCGIGVTIGLLGLFMMMMAGIHNLDFTTITKEVAINKNLLELAFVFILVGFGTKVGFFPLNSWLPDAHGKGSTPISAFMSSILLPLAFYMIIRSQAIIDFHLNSDFTSKMMLFFALVTIVYSGFVMIIQHHYKRALAYSSSENMGIIAFSWALGGLGAPLAQMFSLLHVVGHSFLKTASFMSAGNILLHTHTGQFDKIKNISKYMRNSSILLVISLFMLVGLPPSPLFISELGIIWQAYIINPYYALAFVVGIVLAFSGLLYNFSGMFASKDDVADLKKIDKDFKIGCMHMPIIMALVLAILVAVVFVLNFKF